MQINNRHIAIDQFGEGPAMLLIHGLGGTSNFWRPVITEFADSHRIVVPDLPSAGRSDIDPGVSIDSLVVDMFALLDALDIDQVRLVGHSMGTIVCQHMAATSSDRIRDLVLLGPLAEPPEAARTALAGRAKSAREDGMNDIADVIADVALAAATKATKANAQGFVREMLLRQAPEAYALSCEALARAERAAAEQIRCRSLLITGDEDAVAPEDNVRALARQLGSPETLVLESCGHWTLTERPTAVIEAMRQFYR